MRLRLASYLLMLNHIHGRPVICISPSSLRLVCLYLLFIPAHAVLKLDTRAPKDIQRASNRKIDLPVAQFLHQLEVLKRPTASCVGHGDAAPLRQLADELVVDAALETFDVGGVNEELGAVGLEERDGL